MRIKHHYRAFSLVELTMAMAIMGILAAIAMPRYARAISRYRAGAAAHRIAHDIAQVQSVARMTSTSQTIAFQSDRYQMNNVRDMDSAATNSTVMLRAEPYLASLSAVTLTGGASAITFDGYGQPGCAGSLTVQSGTSSRIVVIDGVTGKASVQ